MATKQCTTKTPPSSPQPAARNIPCRRILTKHAPQNTYDLMAPRQLNIPMVSAALGAVLAEQRQATISEFLSLGEALGVDPRELFNRVLARVHYPVGYRPVKTT
jgi:hypothetical protein